MHRSPHRRPTPHRGFTLIEMLAVILIISLLMVLLVPALSGARVKVKEAETSSEISGLSSALTNFKADFNTYPPSSIILYENTGLYNTNTDANTLRSKVYIRQLWPQFNFGQTVDWNGDGTLNGPFTLAGGQCLVFFLGGIPKFNDSNGNGTVDQGELVPSGFSMAPRNPTLPGGTRKGPYFEFKTDRLIPAPSVTDARFAAYGDPISAGKSAYLYLSSYGGEGYRDLDRGTSYSPNEYAYRQGVSLTAPYTDIPYYLKDQFQIISAGADMDYGPGGPYLPANADSQLSGTRLKEQDNLTNFHSGQLISH